MSATNFRTFGRSPGGAPDVPNWQKVRDLRAMGMTDEEIADHLNMDRSRVYYHGQVARTYEKREQMKAEALNPWVAMAYRLALFYPDERRQNWVLKRMGIETPETDD